MAFLQNKSTRVLMIIISTLVITALVFSYFYYQHSNSSVDPRIVKARALYENYNRYAVANEFDSVFLLMDSIESIYSSVDHYKDSWETGVLYNNRAASFLTMALYTTDMDSSIQDSLIRLAEVAVNRSIEIYDNWLTEFQDKNEQKIEDFISDNFFIGLETYNEKEKENFLVNRIKEIEVSQTETKRRLSVSYTNLGIIYRYRLEYEPAARAYKTALDLWDRNLTAENNLNILLGRPMKKRNIIQKMFPPDRDDN